MIKNNFSKLLLIFLFAISCAKENIKETIINEKSLDLQVLEAYNEGIKSLEEGDVLFAAQKFNEAEILFPQSEWAPKSALMAAYSYYVQDYYSDCIAELKRFIKIYPKHKDLDYAYYLLAVTYYEQIVDEKKDLNSILKAQKYFKYTKTNFPNTEYALDSEFKLDLINDILASKEVYLGRYYVEKKKWVPAINRFKIVVQDFDTTIYVEEALHRLVEIHYILGLKNEAEKYAKLLGYNYQSSEWYENSYMIFNKKYKKREKNNIIRAKKKTNIVLKKFKSLFELDE